jgi:hypothetical protein
MGNAEFSKTLLLIRSSARSISDWSITRTLLLPLVTGPFLVVFCGKYEPVKQVQFASEQAVDRPITVRSCAHP